MRPSDDLRAGADAGVGAAQAARRGPPMWLLVTITFSGTLAMHMFVPALPDAARDLHASAGAVQMTISLYILGLAFGQLFYGPLSDCFGRRPTLMAGLALYAVAGAVSALAPNVEVLIAARLAQALGGCAGLLMGRAIVRDVSHPEDVMRQLALMSLMTLIGPGLSPLVGALIATHAGWRYVFVGLAALGVFNIACAWRLLPETGRPAGRFSMATVAADYRSLLGSRRFLGFAVGGGCATTSFYAFISTAPFTWTHELHRPLAEVGVYLGLMIAGVSAGNLVSNRLARRVDIDRLMVGSAALSLACAIVLLLLVYADALTAPRIGVAMFLFSAGGGMCSPAVMAKSLNVRPQVTGSAAGLYGCTQMVVGALCTSLAALGNNPTLSAAAVMTGAGVIGLLSFRIALRAERGAKHRD